MFLQLSGLDILPQYCFVLYCLARAGSLTLSALGCRLDPLIAWLRVSKQAAAARMAAAHLGGTGRVLAKKVVQLTGPFLKPIWSRVGSSAQVL